MTQATERAGLSARKAALQLIGGVLAQGERLAQAAGDAKGPLAKLSPADRARARRLATETLRHLAQCDAALAPFLRKVPPVEVHNVLRLAVLELSLEPAAAHGIVNAAVSLARAERGGAAMAGLVNAVLRKVAATGDPFAGTALPTLPEWLRSPLVAAYGSAATVAIEMAHAQAAPLDLTLKADKHPAMPGAIVLPNGSLRLADAPQISALPGYAAGDWWVQDAAAAMAVPLLAPLPGERILDLCAAPGGKTMQLASAGARVTALDQSEPRLRVLRENLGRTGLQAEVVVADALHWQPTAAFDAILLDAPCSATGTIRRHPDLPHLAGHESLEALIGLQQALLARALTWLKPGGRLVFCTCSLLPGEGEAQLAWLLADQPGLSVEPPALAWVQTDWITAQGGLRLRPDHWAEIGGMDGFFMVKLRIA